MSVAPDGTIWTVGLERINGDVDAPGVNPNGDVLRHYNASGDLINSAAPKQNFRPDMLEHGFLVATQDRIGWYAQNSGAGQYVEISLPTMTPHAYPGLPGPSDGKYAGIIRQFVLTDGGSAFVSSEYPNLHHRITYMFDRVASRWTAIQMPAIAGQLEPHLRGADGEQLVFTGNHSANFLYVLGSNSQ